MDSRRSEGEGYGRNRYNTTQGEEPAGGGRWENDMYDSTATQKNTTRRDGRYNGNQWGSDRHERGEGVRGGRGRSFGYGADRSGDKLSGDGGGGGRRDFGRDAGGGRNSNSYRGGGGGFDRDQQHNQNIQNWGGEEPLPMASERWQKHAQGAPGVFHHQRGPVQDGKREQGHVCSIKDNFGFVRCVDRPGDLFFHLTEAPQEIAVGDEVDFVIGTGGRSGKDCALQLKVLPAGTIVTETVLGGLFLGVIERDIRSFHPSMPSSQRAQMMGRSRMHEHQQPEGLIKITGSAPAEDPSEKQPAGTADEVAGNTARLGDGGLTSPDDVDAQPIEQAAERVEEDQVPEDDNGMGGVSTQRIEASASPPSAALGLTGAMVPYVAGGTVEEDAAYRFRRGDEVRFRVSQDKASGRKKAVEVVLVKTSRERREEEQLQQLIDSGATRQRGVVKKLTHDYGFLQSLSCSESVYFSTAHVVQGEGSERVERLRVGSQAEFWVVPDRDKDGRHSYRALKIKTLPPGTLVLEEQVHESLQGTVERAPTMPQRSSFGGGGGRGRDAGDGGAQGMQPGAGRFKLPAAVCPDGEEQGEDAGGDGKDQTVVVASLHPKELGKSGVPTLEVGDVIEADIWRSKLGGKQCQARNVRLVKFGGSRDEGVVRSLREGGFGFLRPLQGGDDVYFRVGDVCKNLTDIKEGSEALFTVKESGRGVDKKRATRVEILPKGSLQLEWPLASGVSGVVTQDAKGRSGQGMITVTDGNSLELPVSLKFPKIAARIKEFISQTVEKELVFPSTLTPGERNACHRIAAEAGLGHESRGEESRRTLHMWKPESEEEVAAIKAAEAVRGEEFLKITKERSKNGERSVSVAFSRHGTAPSALEDGTDGQPSCLKKDSKKFPEDDVADADKAPAEKSQLTQDFRKEDRASSPTEAQRGDLVTFDVFLNRGTLKRRATNIRVTKRAAAVPAGANGTFNGQDANNLNTTGGGVGGKGVQSNNKSNGDQKEYMGVVSLVNTDRHFGFIEGIDHDERVFFHLSEVVLQPESDDQDVVKADDTAASMEGDPGVANTPVVPVDQSSGKKSNGPIIERGQEVSFRLGQRQGKSLGLCVKKLKGGTLPSEEVLPTRFVGVVVVAPRTMAGAGGGGSANAEKDAMASAAGMEGMLVVLHAKKDGHEAAAGSEETPTAELSKDEGDEGEATPETAKEANKAQRMLSSAGVLQSSGASPAGAVGISPSKQSNRGGGAKPPPRFALLRFVAPDGDQQRQGEDATAASAKTKTAATIDKGTVQATASETPGMESRTAPCTYQRGDLVEFTVVGRRGLGGGQRGSQGQGAQLRVGTVSLLESGALPCRRGKLVEVNGRGIARVELSTEDLPESADAEKPAGGQQPGDSTRGASSVDDESAENVSKTASAKNSCKVFFFLKEMVGAAGPLRNGDEVDFLLPEGKAIEAGRRAVGAVRVQDLKSLSGARQRLNLDLRDAQKGPQVRMAQGPEGAGFRPGHRTTPSLYASSHPTRNGSQSTPHAIPAEGSETAEAEGVVPAIAPI